MYLWSYKLVFGKILRGQSFCRVSVVTGPKITMFRAKYVKSPNFRARLLNRHSVEYNPYLDGHCASRN